MKTIKLLVTLISTIGYGALAQTPACRQPWMSADTPAFCMWQAESALPEARAYHAVAISDNHVYVLGGFRYDAPSSKVIYYDSVLQATIGSDGRLSVWQSESTFKGARSGAAATEIDNCLFLSGGSSSTPSSLNYFDDVQYAQIKKDGHLSAWALSPNHLRIPRSNHSLVAIRTAKGAFLYAVGGVAQIGNDTVHLDTVEIAKIGANCSLSEWAIANYHFKGGRSTPQALTLGNNIVVVGGWGDFDLLDIYDDVQIASVRDDGSLTPWRTSPTRLTTGIYGHATVFARSEKDPQGGLLLIVGGQPGTGAYANWISYAYIAPRLDIPEAIGVWRIAPSGKLPSGLAGLGMVQFRERLYAIGGSDSNSKYHTDVLSAQFDLGHVQ